MSSIKHRLEKSLVLALRSLPKLKGVTIEGGHSDKKPPLPLMAVYCYDESEHDEMPAETGIKNVSLRIFIEADARHTTRDALDAWSLEVSEFMGDQARVAAKCNKTAEPDMRKVKHLHVYQVMSVGSPDDADDNTWIEEREYEILASPEDAF